ncbi:MAG: acyl-CoA thioesterase [Burkholderiales bacterium]|nr:acyl-CoA thioesterase [Burkholderiales bacterium]
MSKRHFPLNIEIKYRDTDSMGHVSSPVYYEYMQHAYVKYMHTLLELPYTEKVPQIMVKSSCEYLVPAKLGEQLIVETSVTKFGGKSFEIEYEIYRNDSAKTLMAKGASTHVSFDHGTGRTTTVPDYFKSSVEAYQHTL